MEDNWPECVKRLLETGADAPVHDSVPKALTTGRIANVQLLLDAGADINLQTPKPVEMLTPLEAAIKDGRTEMAAFLVGHRADVLDGPS